MQKPCIVSSIECNSLRDILIKSLSGRFNYILNEADFVYACTIVDFRMKNFSFIHDKQIMNDCTKRAMHLTSISFDNSNSFNYSASATNSSNFSRQIYSVK